MSPEPNAPATVDGAGSGPPDAPTAADADADTGCRDLGRGVDSSRRGVDHRNRECDDPDREGDDRDLRTATRLLRLVKLALGALVSLLTALKLLGLV